MRIKKSNCNVNDLNLEVIESMKSHLKHRNNSHRMRSSISFLSSRHEIADSSKEFCVIKNLVHDKQISPIWRISKDTFTKNVET